jgi:hypothetical protein
MASSEAGVLFRRATERVTFEKAPQFFSGVMDNYWK